MRGLVQRDGEDGWNDPGGDRVDRVVHRESTCCLRSCFVYGSAMHLGMVDRSARSTLRDACVGPAECPRSRRAGWAHGPAFRATLPSRQSDGGASRGGAVPRLRRTGTEHGAHGGAARLVGYAALVVDSFSARGMKDVCGRNWPTPVAAEARAGDIDASLAWLGEAAGHRSKASWNTWAIPTVAAWRCCGRCRANPTIGHRRRHAPSCCSIPTARWPMRWYGALRSSSRRSSPWARSTIGRRSLQCRAVMERVVRGRELIETRVYEGAHHSFDALGLPVRYLAGRRQPQQARRLLGAHYGPTSPPGAVRGRCEGVPGQGNEAVTRAGRMTSSSGGLDWRTDRPAFSVCGSKSGSGTGGLYRTIRAMSAGSTTGCARPRRASSTSWTRNSTMVTALCAGEEGDPEIDGHLLFDDVVGPQPVGHARQRLWRGAGAVPPRRR